MKNHTHEFRLTHDSPIIEDGAAIFVEECEWVEILGATTCERLDETFYEEGAECNKTRKYRFEESYLWHSDGRGEPLDGDWESYPARIQRVIERVVSQGRVDVMDPDETCGKVTLKHQGDTLVYKP